MRVLSNIPGRIFESHVRENCVTAARECFRICRSSPRVLSKQPASVFETADRAASVIGGGGGSNQPTVQRVLLKQLASVFETADRAASVIEAARECFGFSRPSQRVLSNQPVSVSKQPDGDDGETADRRRVNRHSSMHGGGLFWSFEGT
jgi:hypothetical protein